MNASTETIWHEFNKKLFAFIQKRVKDTDTSNDILQEIFLKIHLKLNSLSDKDKLASWVYTIARNSILDHFRKQKNMTPLPAELSDLAEDKNFNEEINKCLSPIIEQLPEQSKEAILQTDLGKFSQKEFAELKGLSYTGAKSRVQRARQQLHTLFNECCSIRSDKYGNIIDHTCNKQCGCS